MRCANTIFLLAFFAISPSLSEADSVKTPISHQQSQQAQSLLPHTGLSKNEVERLCGHPDRQLKAIAHPPISRWIYADYVVYFEYDHVVHSVIKH